MSGGNATEDAMKLLERFSSEKKRRSPGHKREGDGLDMAAVDGATLGNTYSNTKKQLTTPTPKSNRSGSRSEEAVDAVRRALYELNDLENEMPSEIKARIPKITRLLQDVEGHLDTEEPTMQSLEYAKKIIFSPADSVSKMQSFDDSFNGLIASDLPLDSTPTGKHVLKVYMDNQLDLQQSEWEKYEETFNTLDAKLTETEELLFITQQERDSFQKELELLRQSLNSNTKTNDDDLQLELESTRYRLADLECEFDKLSEIIEEKNSLLSRRDNQYNDILLQLKDAEEKLARVHLRSPPSDDHSFFLNDAMSPGTRKNMMQEQLDREESELAKYENAINELQQELDHANDLVREKEEECRNISQQHESEVSNLEEQINTLSQLLLESEAKVTEHMTRENQIAGECQDLREKYQVLLAQRDHDLSVIQQFDEEKYSNMHRELEETRRSLKEFQEHDEKLQKQLEEVIHDKDLRIQDYEQLMHRHNDLEKGYQEIQSHNQSLIRDFGNLEEQKNLHYREIVQLQEKLASLQIQNEQKDHSIHRMRKLFSQDIGSDDPLGSKDSDDVPRSPHRSLNTKEDCDRVIDSMERKLRVQVQNLQYLQDTLSEEKQRCKTISEQKRILQEKNASLEMRIVELESEHASSQQEDLFSLQQEIDTLKESLMSSNAEVESLRSQLNTATAEIAVVNNVKASELEEERLIQTVKHLEQDILELTAHNESLEAAITQKSKKIEELGQEIIDLRANVTTLTDDLNRIKSEALHNEATLDAQLLEKDSIIEELSDQLSDSEKEAAESSQRLKDFLLILNEKDSTNEELIVQLQEKIDSLSSQLEKTKEARLRVDAQNFLLSKQLSDAEERLSMFHSREEFELSESNQQLKTLSTKLQDRDMMLTDRDQDNHNLTLTIQELETVISNYKEITSDLEEGKVVAEDEVMSFRRASKFIYEEALYMTDRYEKQVRALKTSVEERTDEFNTRLEASIQQLRRLTHAQTRKGSLLENATLDIETLRNEYRSLQTQYRELESSLQTIQQRALHFESSCEKKDLEITDLKYKLETLEVTSYAPETKNPADPYDIVRLNERFEVLERRAVEMSSQGAKQFARAAKGMALLEAENFQLKSLVDHFRLVNAKLLGDIKVASSTHQESSMIMRYQMLEKELSAALERSSSLELEIREKDLQLLKFVESSHLEDEQRTENFEEELRAEKERSMGLQDQINTQLRTITRLTNLVESLQKQLETEMETAITDAEYLKKELETEIQRAEIAEALSSTLQHQVTELEQMKAELELHHSTKLKIHLEQVEEWKRKKALLQEESDGLRVRIKELEHHLDDQKSKMGKLEDEIFNKESKVEGLKGQIHDVLLESEELAGKLRSVEFSYEQQSLTLHQKDQKISDLTRYLEETRQQVELRDDDVRTVNSKLSKLEDKIRKLASEKLTLETSLEDLRIKNDSLVDESQMSSSRCQELQSDIFDLRQSVASLEEELSDKNMELSNLKSKNEILSRERSTKEKEVKSLEILVDELRQKTAQMQKVEQVLSQRDLEFEDIRNSKERILMDMQAVITRFEGLLVPIHGTSEQSNSSFSVQDLHLLRSADQYDLLTTPLKSVLTPSRDLISASNIRRPEFDPNASTISEIPLQGLSDIRTHFERMVVMVDEQINRYLQLEDIHSSTHQQLTETKRTFEVLDQKYRSVVAERDALLSNLKSSENELASLSEELENVTIERDNARHVSEDQAQWLRYIRRDLQQLVSNEIVTRAATVATTLVGELDESIETQSNSSLYVDVNAGMLIEAHQQYPAVDQVHEAESIISKFCSAIQKSRMIISKDDQTIKKLESQATQAQQRWESERVKLNSRIGDLSAALEREQTLHSQMKSEYANTSSENQKMKNLLSEYTQQIAELQDDLRACVGNNAELKNTLREAEILCGDLRTRIKTLVSEKDELCAEIASFQTDNSSLLTKVTNLEIQVEQWSTDTKRIRAERDALADTRTSLQSQLDSSRAEVALLKERSRSRGTDEDLRATFELERLLAVFGATMEHLQNTLEITPSSGVLLLENGSLDTTASFRKGFLNSSLVEGNPSQPISERVEQTVRHLTELRSWSRDDRRLRRQLEDRISSLEQELEALTISSKLESDELRLSISDHEAKEKDYLEKLNDLESYRSQVIKLDEELSRQRRDKELLLSTLDSDKKSLFSASSTLQNQDFEIHKLQDQLRDKQKEFENLEKLFTEVKHQNSELLVIDDRKDETIRNLKSLNSRLQDTIERHETNLDRVRKEKVDLERKIKLCSDEYQSQIDALDSRSKSLEKEIKESTRQYSEVEKKCEEEVSTYVNETNELKFQIQSLELRLQQATSEAAMYRKESTTTAQELNRLQSKYDKEALEHSKVLATLSSIQKQEENWRLRAEGTTVLMEEEENKLKQMEERNTQLLEQLAELHSLCEQKDASLSTEREKRLRIDQEFQRQNILLERTQRELTSQSAKSSALRAEGRKARKEISQAAEYLREVAGILQSSVAHSTDMNLRITNESMSINLENIDTTPISHAHVVTISATEKDSDPLGIKEITSVFETIKNLAQIVRKIPQNQISMESSLRRLDIENQRLQRELDGIEVVYEDKIQRLESENHLLEEQLRSLKNREMGKKDESRVVSQLQHENNLLRSKCDRADQREKELLLEIASYAETLPAVKVPPHDTSSPSKEGDRSIEQLNREIIALQQELDAVRHHRTVLQDAVAQLELLVYREDDMSPKYLTESSEKDLDQLALQVSRLERKQHALDELIAIYRKGLIGLYPDGSFYSSTQYSSLKSAHGFDSTSSSSNIGSGWIEKEIELIKKSYVTEIDVLEKYCNSLSTRVRQGESYCSELRVRLEDTLRALYKSGKNYTNEILSHQLEHLAVELANSQQKVVSLTQEVSTLSRQGRHRHEQLVEEMTKALQAKDDALRRLRQLETENKRQIDATFHSQQGIIKELNESKALISQLRNEAEQYTRSIKEKDRAILQLRRELIDVDTQLDSERRKRASLRSALEKTSMSSKKENNGEKSSNMKSSSSPEQRTPTSFRLSTRSPPVSPSPYKEGKIPNPQPAQTPEIPSTSSRSKGDATEELLTQTRSFLESRSSSTRSGSAPHSRGRSRYLEMHSTSASATGGSNTGGGSRSSHATASTTPGSQSITPQIQKQNYGNDSRLSYSRNRDISSSRFSSTTAAAVPIPSWDLPERSER